MAAVPSVAFPFKGSDSNSYSGQTIPLDANGAVPGSVADGAHATMGSKADVAPANPTASGSVVGVLKGIWAALLARVSVDTVVQATSADRGGVTSAKASGATVAAPGTSYAIGDTITNAAGVFTTSAVAAVSATIGAGGSGYAANDTITDAAGVWTVSTVSSGAVTAVTLKTANSLTSAPAANPLAQTATSGTGTGATVNVFYGLSAVTATTPTTLTAATTGALTQTATSGAGTGGALTPAYAAASVQVAAANPSRRGIVIQNQDASKRLWFTGLGTATADQHGFMIAPMSAYETPAHHAGTGTISVIGEAAGQLFYAREF